MKIADMHCDTVYELIKNENVGTLKNNTLHVDLDKMISADYMLQNFAMFVNMKEHDDCYERCKKMIEFWENQQKRFGSYIKKIHCIDDIKANNKEGCLSALLTVEEGECCHGDTKKLDKLYEMGIRMMTITWNYENSLGYPATPRCVKTGKKLTVDMSRGLTDKGKKIVSHMFEKLNMIVDVSHLSDKGFYDVLEIAKAVKRPFVASHSNARTIATNPRNLSDEMIRNIGETGGVIGVNFYPPFLADKKIAAKEQLLYIIEHIRHMINKGGIDCVGLGTDFDGIDGELAIGDASKMQMLYDALKKAGFSESETEHVFWKNVIRVYKEVLG